MGNTFYMDVNVSKFQLFSVWIYMHGNTNITQKSHAFICQIPTMEISHSCVLYNFPMCVFWGFEMGYCIYPISTSINGFLQNFPVVGRGV